MGLGCPSRKRAASARLAMFAGKFGRLTAASQGTQRSARRAPEHTALSTAVERVFRLERIESRHQLFRAIAEIKCKIQASFVVLRPSAVELQAVSNAQAYQAAVWSRSQERVRRAKQAEP